jgi:hypothetical protein
MIDPALIFLVVALLIGLAIWRRPARYSAHAKRAMGHTKRIIGKRQSE